VTLESVYQQTNIPAPGVNNTLWIWAAKRGYIDELNGYDELYCRKFAYSREDDDWRERMLANGMPFFDEYHKKFCGVHLWHPAAWRSDQANNQINKDYFKRVCQPVRDVRRNNNWPWGKMLKGSFSVMNGVYREPIEHEQWVKKNRPEIEAHLPNSFWKSLDEMQEELEDLAS
jgi:hypothetical protein